MIANPVISGPSRAGVAAVSVTANWEDRCVTAALPSSQSWNNDISLHKEKDKRGNQYLTTVTINFQLAILIMRKRGIENVSKIDKYQIWKNWKKSYDKTRQCIKTQRHPFADKGPSSQIYGFSSSPVRCESWTIKKAECWRIEAFKLWCWRRLFLESPGWQGNQTSQT